MARRSDANSVATTATGRSHHAATPASVRTAVRPMATTTAAAIRQSSPTMKSYQKRRNAMTYFMRAPRAGCAGPAPRPATRPRQEAQDDEQGRFVAGPGDAHALCGPECPERRQQQTDGELQRVLG